MDFYTSRIFLGFPVDVSFQDALDKEDPFLVSTFLQPHSDYLQEVYFKKTRYLGKFVEKEGSLETLELLEVHIYSLLKKIVNNFPCDKVPLLLFPVIISESSLENSK